MKLMHITDIHGDLEVLDVVREDCIKRNDLEVIACSGDYLGELLNRKQVERMRGAFSFITSAVETDKPISFKAFLEFILKSEKAPKPLKQASQDYIEIVREFDEKAEEQYKKLIDIFKQFPQQVLTIPGNWDCPDYFKFFEEFDIHEKNKEINGIKFAGYGGADMVPIFLPPTRTLDFSEENLCDFLIKEDPDVAMTHVPPYGLQDKSVLGNHPGSWANLAYIRTESPVALLCGHCHEGRGISKDEHQPTIIINSGNLGEYEGNPNKGTFYEIELNNKGVISAIPYKVINGGIIRDKNADSVNSTEQLDKQLVE